MSRYIVVTEYLRKERWCEENGWTEPFYQGGKWYAFPPGGVMPLPIPTSFFELLYLVFK